MNSENELQLYEINGKDSISPVINEFSIESWGLTKREYFAGLAMQGLIDCKDPHQYIAELSVKIADALLKELDK